MTDTITIARDEKPTTDAKIDAAEAYAELFKDDDRECIQTDVMNAFYAGIAFSESANALDNLAAESQRLGLYDNNSVLVPCDKLKEMQDHLIVLQDKARAVVKRWDSPDWKDPHTAVFIHALRDAIG